MSIYFHRSLMVFLISVFLFFECHHAFAQQLQPGPQFATPNAAAMAVYNQYSPSNSTGTPNINGPVYNLPYSEYSMPIELTYNVNGVKPDENGSWVGLGRNLNAGSAVIRTTYGRPDDMNYYSEYIACVSGNTNQGYFYNVGNPDNPTGHVNASDWTSLTSWNMLPEIIGIKEVSDFVYSK